MRDAQRYIVSVPHGEHGVSSTNYGLQASIRDTDPAAQNPFHATIANHLSTDGITVNGDENADKLLDKLGIQRTPVAKVKAKELIDMVGERGAPLQVSTIKDILLSGKIPNIDGLDLNHFTDEEMMNKPEEELDDHEAFYRHARENGYHEAMNHFAQRTDKKAWKTHLSHAIPRAMGMKLHPQMFKDSLRAAGIGAIKGDIHGAKNVGSQTPTRKTNDTKNHLDTIVHFDPRVLEEEEGVFTPDFESPKQQACHDTHWASLHLYTQG